MEIGKDSNGDFEESVKEMLHCYGFLFPMTERQVRVFEEIFDISSVELPKPLNDALVVLKKGWTSPFPSKMFTPLWLWCRIYQNFEQFFLSDTEFYPEYKYDCILETNTIFLKFKGSGLTPFEFYKKHIAQDYTIDDLPF